MARSCKRAFDAARPPRARRLRACFGSLFLLTCVGGANAQTGLHAAPPADAAKFFDAGCAQLRAGKPQAAIAPLAEAVARQPEHLDYALKLAEAYVAAGRNEAAESLLGNLSTRLADSTPLATALARVQAERGEWGAVERSLAPHEGRLEASELLLLARARKNLKQPSRAEAVLRGGLQRFVDSEALWMAYIEAALEEKQYAAALERIAQAERRLERSAALKLLAAETYFRLGQGLGTTSVHSVPDGQAGQFAGQWLLVEKRREPDVFLCCPRQSALYQLRGALDAGIDQPRAHLLHARIWHKANRSAVAFSILKAREAALLTDALPDTLALFADTALACGELADYLRYAVLRADREPKRRNEILHDAYLTASERYSQRGNDALHREFLRRALEIRAGSADLMLQLADAYWDSGQRQEAAAWYQRMLEREPSHPQRQRVLERLGQ